MLEKFKLVKRDLVGDLISVDYLKSGIESFFFNQCLNLQEGDLNNPNLGFFIINQY